MQNPPQRRPQNQLLIQWIIWGTLLFSYLVYGYICHSMTGEAPLEDWKQLFLLKPLIFMSTIMLVLSHVLPRRIFMESLRAMPEVTDTAVAMRMVVPNIIAWALTESVAVYGLLLALRSRDIMPFYVFAGIGALNMLVLRPNPEKWTGIAKDFTRQDRRS
jgi:Na+/phosphate symporter